MSGAGGQARALFAVVLPALLMLWADRAHACRGLASEGTPFLGSSGPPLYEPLLSADLPPGTFPDAVLAMPVVAVVRVIAHPAAPPGDPLQLTEVEPVRLIRGPGLPVRLIVAQTDHSCAMARRAVPGGLYLIAGQIEGGVFRGAWRGNGRTIDLR
ncbi:MAG: hypothetical protein IOC80_14410 [Rhodobacter sp.]|nr:hypothetical protein [Rhodobacter sp.]MCA3514871.1 hypothetical protein [Rhodobacter sp.]MCA3520182.1 hypothetical protein [Rhodobacter sp.]MCA3522113.1 hypothetical protein [Rhodobacter sp.]MCA3524687.1 hypothetical protein [Rhodobacter sp.]